MTVSVRRSVSVLPFGGYNVPCIVFVIVRCHRLFFVLVIMFRVVSVITLRFIPAFVVFVSIFVICTIRRLLIF